MFGIEKLHKSYGTQHIFENVSLAFPEGKRISLVGANGAGKTTLLKIILGEEEADAGKVIVGKDKTMAALPQEANQHPEATILAEVKKGAGKIEEIAAEIAKLEKCLQNDSSLVQKYTDLTEEYRLKGGYAVEANAKMILIGLGFSQEQFDRSPTELSGGWRMRVELAKLFLQSPDILVLDEPTNHLDLPAINWFRRYMKTYEGTMLFVSHDRSLMNELAEYCVQVQGGHLKMYKGNFDAYLEQHAIAEQQKQEQLARIEKKKKHMQDFVDRFGSKATKARQAQSRVKMIERLEKMANSYELTAEQKSMAVTLPEPPPSGRKMVEANDLAIGYDSPLGKPHNFFVERGMRIAIVGANGLGKTTLLKTISGLNPKIAGKLQLGERCKIAYFAQEQFDVFNPRKSIFENLYSRSDIGDLELRSLLGAFLFSNEAIQKEVRVLSGGEKSRVGLAAVLATKGNMLLLDEPTNHLDLMSIDRLAAALIEYTGTVMFVSHQRDFVNQVATHVYGVFADHAPLLVEGDLDDFDITCERLAIGEYGAIKKTAEATAGSAEQKSHQLQRDERKKLKTDRHRANKEKKSLESSLEGLNKKIAALVEEQAGLTQSDFVRLSSLAEELDRQRHELAKKEERWLELEEIVAEFDEKLK